MNDLGTVPPIPYAAQHTGPRRVLAIRLRRGVIAASAVQVNIDGALYPQPWGDRAFEIPADRPVAIAVFQTLRGNQSGLATCVLTPDSQPMLEYRGPAHLTKPGELGPPGTVRQQGLVLQGCLLVTLLLLLLVAVVVFGYVLSTLI